MASKINNCFNIETLHKTEIHLLYRKSANLFIGILVTVNNLLKHIPNTDCNSSLYLSSRACCGGGKNAPERMDHVHSQDTSCKIGSKK
jgi:hypothetical protein